MASGYWYYCSAISRTIQMSADEKSIYKEVFSSVLKQRRNLLNITQEELAARADIAVRYVGHLEGGHRQPTISVFFALAYALETTPSELMQNYDDEMPKDKLNLHPHT